MAATPVTQHYARPGIAERVLAALREANGSEAPVTPEALASIDQFHGRGVVATGELLRLLDPQPGESILDIGCGIGGPARWIAAKIGCHVTGVDLTPEFCEAAVTLNAACGMADCVTIHNGSALDLPLSDAVFDRAYSQNVVMNIDDKARFYREALRVLRPGGVLALSNVCAGPAGPPHFPVPWAETSATSFLATPDETRGDIASAGFEILSFRDTSEELRDECIGQGSIPPLGLQIVMGDRFSEMRRNSARSAAENRTRTVEILARKPVRS